MFTATLYNWDNTSRAAGSAYIRIFNGNTNQWAETVTVAVGQSAKAALDAAGWSITSGVRRSQGRPVVMVERKRPGLAEVNRRMTSLIAPAVGLR